MENTHLQLEHAPVARAALLIRQPVSVVFEAFVDPQITNHFWFTRSSGRLVQGKQVRWDWEMFDVHAEIEVIALVQDRRIAIRWPGLHAPTLVEWEFTPRSNDATFVSIKNAGFSGSGDEVVDQVIDATEGFTLVLVGAKAYLEQGLDLNLIKDHSPG